MTHADSEFLQRDRSIHPPAFTPDYKTIVLRSPRRAMLSAAILPVGGDRPDLRALGTRPARQRPDPHYAREGEPIGERIFVHGHVRDENGGASPTPSSSSGSQCGGRYRHRNDRYLAPIDPNFGGCGRTITDENGFYYFRTIKPGPYPCATTSIPGARPISTSRVRLRLRPAPHHPDVFRGRPADLARPDGARDSRSLGRRAADRPPRPQAPRCRSTCSPTSSTSCCAAASRRSSRTSSKETER